MESYQTDLVVIGAGAAGLLAAVAAHRLGEDVLVVEASATAGTNTAAGEGLLWLPANPVAGKDGSDSAEDAATYLESLLGATDDRLQAFARTAPKLARWMVSSHVPLTVVDALPDHHPEQPGARTWGRVVQVTAMDRRILREWDSALAPAPGAAGPFSKLPLPRRTRTGGEALIANLLHRATANGVQLWLESRAVELISEADRVTGVRVIRDGVEYEVLASRVLLAGGGFEGSQDLREEYLPLPTDAAWTTVPAPGDGNLLKLATTLGADTAGLDDAWWIPVMVADGRAHDLEAARGKPHSLIVDSAGDRYFNEATDPDSAGRAMFDRGRGVRTVPSYLIGDNRHRQHHQLGPWPSGNPPKRALEAGEVVRADTLNDLAQELGIDRAGLLGTVVRFNNFVAKGSDLDFGRGEAGWDIAQSEQTRKGPVTLGKVDKPPFWAVRVYPGDIGTKGGLRIDSDSRVMRSDNSPIDGLYACAGVAESSFRGISPAPGAALAESLVTAFLAATDQLPERRRAL